MPAGLYNPILEQGADFTRLMTWYTNAAMTAAKDLTGWTGRMQIRSAAGGDLLIELTTENDRILLGGEAGTIQLYISSTDTAALAPGAYVYDLELVSGEGAVTRFLQGVITVSPEVTV